MWIWSTERVDVDSGDIDGAVKAFLYRHRALFRPINENRGLDSDLYLELVTYYQEGEAPPGLYLSAEALKLLSESTADFDNDAVPDVRLE